MDVMRARESHVPIPVARAMTKLGEDIQEARKRRRIPTALMAQRASISRTTLHKVERGDPGVSMGTYATVLFVLGLEHGLAELADLTHDPLGLQLEEEQLPERIRTRKKRSQG